ncbi:MAG: class I SAM-dependent methyltransferase [Solirubrobacteraceae bacterium]
MIAAAVAWHDVECHGYDADLPLWLALAGREAGPVLDVGAGTGRVALALAAAGHDVVALDLDRVLLDALAARARARGLAVETVLADAEAFDVGTARFGLVLVPMQTLQLLGDRPAFLGAARRALRRGGLLAAAIADELVAFDVPEPALLPDPDVAELDGWRYVSQPTAVRVDGDRARIERLRTTEAPDGGRTTEANAVELAVCDPPGLAREARAVGLIPVPGERIPPTGDHVGASVVAFRA